MKAIKVLILANDTTYVYNLRKELIQRLVADGHSVAVASEPLLLQDELKEMGCRLIDVQVGRHGVNPMDDLKLCMQYIRILRREKPDVVLSYNIKPNVYGGAACRLLGIDYIPNITGLGTAVEYPGRMQALTTRLYRWGVSGAACVMFQNDENERFFREHKMLKANQRTRLLPGSGVALERHIPLAYPGEGTVNFLFVARIMKEKGIDLYLGAAKKIHERYGNVMFHICGKCDNEEYVAILKNAEESGYLKYHGEQKRMQPFFEMAHCVVHPSYYPEGMSNVLLEAAASARPIIATDRSGCRETVDDGVNGFVVPIKEEAPLVEAIEKFLALDHDQRKEMGLAGRRKMEREFDRQIVVRIYMEEIARLK